LDENSCQEIVVVDYMMGQKREEKILTIQHNMSRSEAENNMVAPKDPRQGKIRVP
jgi:hypothetical protein